MLPGFAALGYSVINIDWPVEAGPDSLYEGFGAKNFSAVDPLLGSDADWNALVHAARTHHIKLVADFNPSYFWTGAPAFRQAIADVRRHGLDALPAHSTARWFRWTASCPGASPRSARGR